jgi:hypothetical protein
MVTQREPNHIFCVQCGTSNLIQEKEGGGIKSCSKCKKQIVTMIGLLTDLHLTSEEYGECAKCKHANLSLHTHCFFCGAKWREG